MNQERVADGDDESTSCHERAHKLSEERLKKSMFPWQLKSDEEEVKDDKKNQGKKSLKKRKKTR